MMERESVTTCLPGKPRSSAADAMASRTKSGSPASSLSSDSNIDQLFSSLSTFWPKQGAEACEPFVDVRQAGLAIRRELRPGPDEALPVPLEHPQGLRVEAKQVASPIEGVDAGKQRGVHRDPRGVPRQPAGNLGLERLDDIVGVRPGAVPEERGDAGQRLAGLLEGDDGIVEAGFVRALRRSLRFPRRARRGRHRDPARNPHLQSGRIREGRTARTIRRGLGCSCHHPVPEIFRPRCRGHRLEASLAA